MKGYNSGPLGGDQQIGAKIVEGGIDFVIFFSDPLEAQPHDPDVKALLRIAQVYDIPIANNKATADFMVTSKYMEEEYQHEVLNFRQSIANRVEAMKQITGEENMEKKEILRKLDHTLLKQTATWEQIQKICEEGMEYQTASVCIPPCYVKRAKEYVGDRLPICTVIGFPNGNTTTQTKVQEAREALADGADRKSVV